MVNFTVLFHPAMRDKGELVNSRLFATFELVFASLRETKIDHYLNLVNHILPEWKPTEKYC
jgi:hypothetical protein